MIDNIKRIMRVAVERHFWEILDELFPNLVTCIGPWYKH
ncbi:Uncharacterised protein [Mycobacteroides abscessus subsp. abscessus]|nr:Uncharacterised protein [Mycobacteroides abscessus subsp. abscessus]